MLKHLAIGVAALTLCVPASAAMAHDDEDSSFYGYWQHGRDHEEHRDFHGDEAGTHAQAHERGFYSPYEHAQWHENARDAHRAFHEDHPDTWHDHRGWRRHYQNRYSGYGDDYGYRSDYGYRGY